MAVAAEAAATNSSNNGRDAKSVSSERAFLGDREAVQEQLRYQGKRGIEDDGGAVAAATAAAETTNGNNGSSRIGGGGRAGLAL